MIYLQIIPLLALLTFLCYIGYYYCAPMIRFRMLAIVAYQRRHCQSIQVTEEKLIVTFSVNGEDRVIERPLGVDLASRFLVMTLCSLFKSILKEARAES